MTAQISIPSGAITSWSRLKSSLPAVNSVSYITEREKRFPYFAVRVPQGRTQWGDLRGERFDTTIAFFRTGLGHNLALFLRRASRLRRRKTPQLLRHGPQCLRGSLEAKVSGAHLAGPGRRSVVQSSVLGRLSGRDATSASPKGNSLAGAPSDHARHSAILRMTAVAKKRKQAPARPVREAGAVLHSGRSDVLLPSAHPGP